MFALGRVVAKNSVQSVKAVAQKRVAVNAMSTLLDRREHAEEAKFIRSLEVKRQEEIRANLERIMALEDHHEEKKELVGLLGA
jgi:hypothetical protein